MSRLGRGLAVAGIGTVLFGALLLVTPPLAASLTTSEAVVSALGVAVFVGGGAGLVRGRADRTTGGDRPARSRAPVVGSSFEEQLRSRSAGSRDRLETAAVDVLTRLRGLDPETARARLERGDWTDDRAAAAFFAPDVVDRRLRRPTWLGGEPAVVRQARAVVGALAGIVDEETPDTGADDRAAVPPVEHEHEREPAPGAGGHPLDEYLHDAAARPELAPVAAAPEQTTTGRWAGIGSLTLLTVALAVVARRPALLVPAAVGVAMVAYAAYGRAGEPATVSLAVERATTTDTPEQGEEVVVTVTVRNEGERMLPDVRLVDGVPPELTVTDGTPRAVATLRPDETVRFRYTVTAEYGDHEFDPPLVALRDATGERERLLRPSMPEGTLSCHPRRETRAGVPLRAETTGHVGRIAADDGGSGLSFHAVRDHRPGDPLSLVDWKRLARTGDLATIEFQRERRADVVLAVDGRAVARAAPDATARSALSRSVEAADVLATTLLGAGNRVGVSALSPQSTWLPPGSGTDHEVRLRELLATAPAFAATPTDEPFVQSVYLARLRRRLTEGTQVVLVSPLVDDAPLDLVRQLEAGGVPVTVVSPDPTDGGGVGGTLARVERRTRIAALRRRRIHVVDWDPADRLELALARNDDVPVVVG